MTNRDARSGNLVTFLVVMAVLAGFQPGLAEDQGIEQRIERVRNAAMQGDADAQYALGFAYYYGFAAKWVHKGDTRARHYLSRIYEDGGGVSADYQEAVEWFRKAAELGHVEAQAMLATLYQSGHQEGGVLQSHRKAVEWWRRAAEQGHAPSQINLGGMYFKGLGVLENYGEAVKWFRKAGRQGNALAQFKLGTVYDFGWGVPEDDVKAYAWMILAAAQGEKDAIEAKDSLREKMTAEKVAEAQKLAAELYKRVEASKPE